MAVSLQCERCQKTFEAPPAYARRARFCSVKCRTRIIPCAHCGKDFKPRRKKTHIFCSYSCSAQHRGEAAKTRTCGHCGVKYAPSNGGKNFCSSGCYHAFCQVQADEKARAQTARVCAQCGVVLTVPGAKTCSRTCQAARAKASGIFLVRERRTCGVCGKEFECRPSEKVKYCSKVCSRTAIRRRCDLRTDRHRAWKRRYGLDPKEAYALIDQSRGCCEICKKTLTLPKGSRILTGIKHAPSYTAVIDHDHNTGNIRGVLCRHCNSGLGFFCDSVERMQRAIEYIKRSSVTEASA